MTDDLERDAVFAQRVRLFRWVQECHLDVPEGEQSTGFLTFAEQELLKINHYKAPRDKMICILNCCKVIFGELERGLADRRPYPTYSRQPSWSRCFCSYSYICGLARSAGEYAV